MKKVIGVDAGGSKTFALLVSETGTVLGRVRAGGANPRSVGRDRAALSLQEALTPLLSTGQVTAICVGAAGIGRDEDRAFFESEVRGIAGPNVTILLRNDAEIALRAGTEVRPAMVVIAGTGSLVYGESENGEGVRCGGYGALLGDDASAYALGLGALKHAARALDGIEKSGLLSAAVLEAVNARSVSQLIERIHHWPPDVGAVAALAPLVNDAADSGDVAAWTLVQGACDSLAAQVARVASRIRTASVLPVVTSGGAFDAVPPLLEAVSAGAGPAGSFDLLRLSLEPAHGAALLALEAAAFIQNSR